MIHGSLICDRISEFSPADRLDPTYSTYYSMGPMIANGFKFGIRPNVPPAETIRATRTLNTSEYVDHDILGGFGPSRMPPRVAFKLLTARTAIEREIANLLLAKPNGPPSIIEVPLNDSRYASVPRVHSALAIKRKGIDSCKGSLCV